MSENFWEMMSVGLAAAMVLMVGVWLFAKWINNASVVDVAWSLGFTVLVLIYWVLGTGAPDRKTVIAVMVSIWSLRLGMHLWRRVAKHHPEEDGRYASLRDQFPDRPWLMFFGFFQLQAVLLAVLTVPFAFVAQNQEAVMGPLEWTGIGIWLVAMLGEGLADWQLDRFRSKEANKGEVCQRGLWRYSRHPNYFFEWLVWVGFFVFALGTEDGWIAVFCPAIMLYFLLKVTGVPTAEEQSLKSRGDKYREYQRTTSVFVPWFPRRGA
jgi:steroid 5-alpha reductase family enzyme